MPPTWREVAASGGPAGDRPLLIVHGNCQAEALRVLCAAAAGDDIVSVRIPPVFEIAPGDIDAFQALVRRTTYLITQPIVDDYRGLPVGTRQVLAGLPASARVATVPVLRWAALHPTHAIVRAPGVGDPPGVPYHDLRVLAAAARGDSTADLTPPPPEAVRAVADMSRDQLRLRQEHHGTVDAVALFEAAGAAATWTINHPGNAVLMGVADQALERLGLAGTVTDPGRVLLRTTTAPVAAATLAALDLTGSPRPTWVHAGQEFTEAEIAAMQLRWYRDNPSVVAAGLRRHADAMALLGLGTG